MYLSTLSQMVNACTWNLPQKWFANFYVLICSFSMTRQVSKYISLLLESSFFVSTFRYIWEKSDSICNVVHDALPWSVHIVHIYLQHQHEGGVHYLFIFNNLPDVHEVQADLRQQPRHLPHRVPHRASRRACFSRESRIQHLGGRQLSDQ